MATGSWRARLWGLIARRHPSAFLLAAQLVSLMLYPLMDDTTEGRLLFGAVALVVVPLAVWVVNRSQFVNAIGWLLAIPAMLLTLVGVLFDYQALLPWSALLESVLYFYAAGSLISYMLHDHEVTGDELFAAGATFTLLAWGFAAHAYFVCQAWYPGSFSGAVEPDLLVALDGAAVPQFHHLVGRRAGRRAAVECAGAGVGDAGDVHRRGLPRHGGVAPDQPDGIATRARLIAAAPGRGRRQFRQILRPGLRSSACRAGVEACDRVDQDLLALRRRLPSLRA